MKVSEIAAATDKWHGVCADMPLAEAAASCRWLSGLCDGARTNDGAGWSRFDHEAGLRLGMLPDAKWTDGDLSMGRHLSHKYRKQLALRPPLETLGAKRRKLFGAQPRTEATDKPLPCRCGSVPVDQAKAEYFEVFARCAACKAWLCTECQRSHPYAPEVVCETCRQNLVAAPPPLVSDDPFARIEATDGKESLLDRALNEDVPSVRIVPAAPKCEVLTDRQRLGVATEDEIRQRVERREATAGIRLDESQRAALDLIARSPIAILTGGPGTGKTTITQQVVRDVLTAGKQVVACAPTGIAASRLGESIGYPAVTIHRALGAIPMGEGIMVVQPETRDATARADLVVIDEMSMVTSRLFAELLQAVKPDARLLLIGDPDQLAPVGSGQPFTDLIESGAFPVARLTTVHRQAEGSRILEACDLVRRGEWYSEPPQADRDSDLVWLEEDSEERLADLCEDVMVNARKRYSASDITLITPRVTGGTAGNVTLRTEELNRRLQQRLNPAAAGQMGEITAGDPIVCTKNRPRLTACGTAPAARPRWQGTSCRCGCPTARARWWTASTTASWRMRSACTSTRDRRTVSSSWRRTRRADRR